jgi:transposase
MARRILSDKAWEQFADALATVQDRRGAPPELTAREFLEAVLYLARTGAPWRDLPAEFGTWISVYMRFRRWERSGVWRKVWAVLQQGATPLALQLFVDSTSIPVHPHAAGARKKTARRRLWDVRAAG